MKQYRFSLTKVNTLTGLLNELIDKSNAGIKTVSIINIQGFINCMANIDEAEYTTVLNEDDNSIHLAVKENKVLIATIVQDKEMSVASVRKFIKA